MNIFLCTHSTHKLHPFIECYMQRGLHSTELILQIQNHQADSRSGSVLVGIPIKHTSHKRNARKHTSRAQMASVPHALRISRVWSSFSLCRSNILKTTTNARLFTSNVIAVTTTTSETETFKRPCYDIKAFKPDKTGLYQHEIQPTISSVEQEEPYIGANFHPLHRALVEQEPKSLKFNLECMSLINFKPEEARATALSLLETLRSDPDINPNRNAAEYLMVAIYIFESTDNLDELEEYFLLLLQSGLRLTSSIFSSAIFRYATNNQWHIVKRLWTFSIKNRIWIDAELLFPIIRALAIEHKYKLIIDLRPIVYKLLEHNLKNYASKLNEDELEIYLPKERKFTAKISARFILAFRYLHLPDKVVEEFDAGISQGYLYSIKTFGSYLHALFMLGRHKEGIECYENYTKYVIPGANMEVLTVQNCAIQLYCKLGLTDEAIEITNYLRSCEKLEVNEISFIPIIRAFGEQQAFEQVTRLIARMKRIGIYMGADSYRAILEAYAYPITSATFVEYLQEKRAKGFREDLGEMNARLLLQLRSDNLEEAIKVLEEMQTKKINPNLYTFQKLMYHHAFKRNHPRKVLEIAALIPERNTPIMVRNMAALKNQIERSDRTKRAAISKEIRKKNLEEPKVSKQRFL